MGYFGLQHDTTTRLNSPGSNSTIMGHIFRVCAAKGPFPERGGEGGMMGAAIETNGERPAPAQSGFRTCHGPPTRPLRRWWVVIGRHYWAVARPKCGGWYDW